MPIGTNMPPNVFLELIRLPDTSDYVKHFLKEKITRKTSYFSEGCLLKIIDREYGKRG